MADAGLDALLECTSPAGARVDLDGTGSFDPEPNIISYLWLAGGPVGTPVGDQAWLSVQQALGVSESYALRVIDEFGQRDEDEKSVTVEDTTAPVIACNAPRSITPSDAPLTFSATAVDTCDSSVVPEITGFECTSTKKGRVVEKRESCIVTVGSTDITIWDSGGVGDRIAWQVRASDDTGNTSRVDCALEVVNKNKP